MFRASWFGWLLLPVLFAGCGCSSADKVERAGWVDPYGGQTGSLIPTSPTCGTAPSFEQTPAVPAGDTVFVYYDTACAASVDDFRLTDEAGNDIQVELLQFEGGAVGVQAGQALAPGEYALEGPDGTKTVVVTEAEPLPTKPGTLTALDGCPGSALLSFDDEVKPFLPLLSLSYRIGGGEPETWYDYGLIDADDGELQLNLAWCNPGPCLRDGSFEVEVLASIAGESTVLETLSQRVSQDCASRSNGDAGGGGACSVARPGAFGSVSGGCLFLALFFARWTRRRRRGGGSVPKTLS